MRTQYWSQTNDYSDVAFNKWYNNAISTLSNMGIICGYPDGSFRPDAPITRAELTKIAASFFSDPRVAATYDGRFSDVHGAEWYISYLMTALEEGLIEGYPDGSFRRTASSPAPRPAPSSTARLAASRRRIISCRNPT
ncbi:MAG: S-layer homology domain-containing protein [Oscillospiraceae bacterium]